jgi:hypothetical protein
MLRSPTAIIGREPLPDLVEKLQLVREFRIGGGIGDIAAGRDVEIVQLDAARQIDDRVAAVGARAPAADRRRGERQA